MNERLWRLLGSGLVVVLAARLCYLVIRVQGPTGPVRRPHIESAALLLGVFGLIVRFATDEGFEARRKAPSDPTGHEAPPYSVWLGLVGCSFALYWPALHVGLLSDDFILSQHALRWDVSQVAPQLFRPLPLFVWAIVLHMGGGATALHGLNILLHGTNAYLAARVVAGWVQGRWWPMLAAIVFLGSPLGPEAVVWCSGTFDLFATMFCLCAVLAARRAAPTPADRVLLAGASIGALLSKETAVVLPLLLLVDAAIRRSLNRRVLLDFAIVAAFALAFGIVRLQSATPVEMPVLTRYRFQRLIFDSIGALGAPWQATDPGLVAVRTGYALCVILLICAFFVNRGSRGASWTGLGGTVWVLASILPLLAFFHVGPQLEGGRYLYLAACGWSAVVVAAAADIGSRGARTAAVVSVVPVLLMGAGVWGVRQHLRPWTEAATQRDSVLRVASGDQRLRSCPVAYVEGLPDSVEGAYLFANGAREALADAGVTAFARAGTGECAFRWDPASSRFVTSAPDR